MLAIKRNPQTVLIISFSNCTITGFLSLQDRVQPLVSTGGKIYNSCYRPFYQLTKAIQGNLIIGTYSQTDATKIEKFVNSTF